MVEINVDQLLKIATGIAECKTQIDGIDSKIETLFTFHNDQVEKQNNFMMTIHTKLSNLDCSEKGTIKENSEAIASLKILAYDNRGNLKEVTLKREWKANLKSGLIKDLRVIGTILGIFWFFKKMGWF